jgi:hypothetical protein
VKLYYVHNYLNPDLPVKVCYDCDAAERATDQWCRVQEVTAHPVATETYQASVDNFCDFYKQLAS